MTTIICSVGGGISSTLLVPLKVQRDYPDANIVLLMAWLPNEHPDVLRLVGECERLTGLKVQFIGTGETPMQVFHRVGMLGNSRVDPCSRILKREAIADYIADHYDPTDTMIAIGITAHEATRVDRRIAIRANWSARGWQTIFPLEYDETLTRERQLELCQELCGWVPEMYQLGFEHHNCGGACVKAGKRQWSMLLWHYPHVYSEWEAGETAFRANHGKDVSILRDEWTRNGERGSTPLTLYDFRVRMQAKWASMLPGFDPFDGLDSTPACVYCEAM